MDELKPQRVKPSRILSIDYGMSRLGLALSDERKIIASPLPTLPAEKQSEKTVLKVLDQIKAIEEKQQCTVEKIVIGLPLMMNGKVSFLADEVRHFADLLKQHVSIPIILWDERLTSVQADRAMREGSLTRKRRAQNADALSAVIILQNYLDSTSTL